MKKVILAFRVVLFAVALVWVLCLLMVGVVFFPGFTFYVNSYGIVPGITSAALSIWYWITLVITGILTTVWAFRRVGQWEKKK